MEIKPQPFKRVFDVALATIALIPALPLMLVISPLIALKMGRPVLFGQERIGRGGKTFKIYKYRSMNDRRDENGDLLPDAERLTSLGRFLRKSSLDELPQLFNVLRGDVSLVGPRPLLVRYLPRYSAEQNRRHEVMPGITGWAQVNGRNAISWEQKFNLDVWYVDHWSLWLDLRILFMTVAKVVRREGISQAGEATMSEFLGSGSDS